MNTESQWEKEHAKGKCKRVRSKLCQNRAGVNCPVPWWSTVSFDHSVHVGVHVRPDRLQRSNLACMFPFHPATVGKRGVCLQTSSAAKNQVSLLKQWTRGKWDPDYGFGLFWFFNQGSPMFHNSKRFLSERGKEKESYNNWAPAQILIL